MASIISHNPEETRNAGRRLAESLGPGEVLALCGDLGAGKTHFVKGLADGLGCASTVTSPTFTLLHEYPGGRLPLYHADLYRLQSEEEALSTGLEDYFAAGGVTVIEWADKFPHLLPATARWIRLAIGENDRRLINLEEGE